MPPEAPQPKKEIHPPLFIAILLVAAGLIGSFQVYQYLNPLEDVNQGEIPTGSGQGILPYESGVRGLVTIGPVCPVERVPPDPNCADRPYQATLKILNGAGKVVVSQKINTDGTYKFSLPPGRYTIENGVGSMMPSLSPVSVEVGASGYVEVDLSFDSGIR